MDNIAVKKEVPFVLIFGFTGKFLEKNSTVTSNQLSRFIAKDENAGKLVDGISDVLNSMVDMGWLEVFESDEIETVYRRFVSEEDKKRFLRISKSRS